jgi:hypothetical protein
MVKKRVPVTGNFNAAKPSKPISNTQKRISIFHTLSKNLEATDSIEEKEAIQLEIDGLGGLDAYQKASMKGGAKGASAIAKYVTDHLPQPDSNEEKKIRLLDVGSLSNSYLKYSWIDGTV